MITCSHILFDFSSRVGSLIGGELAGERMSVALIAQDQEDEHSCFSDNTHRDIVTNAQGVSNVLNGDYIQVDGTTISGLGLIDLIATADVTLAGNLAESISNALVEVDDIDNAQPFDQLISGNVAGGQEIVQEAIDALRAVRDAIQAVIDEVEGLNAAFDLDGE